MADEFESKFDRDDPTSGQDNNEGQSDNEQKAFEAPSNYQPGDEVEWTSDRTGKTWTFRIPGAAHAIPALGSKFVGDEMEINPVSPEMMRLAQSHISPNPNFNEMSAGDAFELLSAFVSYLF